MNAILIDEGAHKAILADVFTIPSSFGERTALRFRVTAGDNAGAELVQSAAPKLTPRSKLSMLVRGLLGRTIDPGEEIDVTSLVGTDCNILVKTKATQSGREYSEVCDVFK